MKFNAFVPLLAALSFLSPVPAEETAAKEKKSEYTLTITGEKDSIPEEVVRNLEEAFHDGYPRLVADFEDKDNPAPREVELHFKTDMPVPAYAGGNTVTVSVGWITKNPNDIGIITHEATHLVQRYKRPNPGWLTEGIADYTRLVYGPKEQPGWSLPNRFSDKNRYDEGYRVSARFLLWVESKNPGTVQKLNVMLQKGEFTMKNFERVAGGSAEELWEQCKKEVNEAAGN